MFWQIFRTASLPHMPGDQRRAFLRQTYWHNRPAKCDRMLQLYQSNVVVEVHQVGVVVFIVNVDGGSVHMRGRQVFNRVESHVDLPIRSAQREMSDAVPSELISSVEVAHPHTVC